MKSVLAVFTIMLGIATPAYAQAPMQNTYGGAQPIVAPPAAGLAQTDDVAQQPPLLSPSEQGVKGDAVSNPTEKAAKQGVGAVAPVGTAATRSPGALPFTGFDVLVLLAGGGLLVAVGFGMRRLSRGPGSA